MKSIDDIYILGVGHNTIVYIDLAEICGYNVKGLYHYNNDMTGKVYWGYPIIGSFETLFSQKNLQGLNFALSQGDNDIREKCFKEIKKLGGNIPTIIHPKATVSKFSKLDEGVIVHANAVIDPDTKIGCNSVISFNAGICHSCIVGNHCFLAPGALLGAYTIVEDKVFMGICSKSVSGKVEKIGYNAYIGADALLTKSVRAKCIMIGSPAREYLKGTFY